MYQFLKLLAALFLFSLVTASCGDDEPDCEDTAELNRLLDDGALKVTNAATAYGQDQSEGNCNALKDAYNDWIDDLSNLQSCADEVGQGDEFRDAINQSRDALNLIPC